MTSPNDLHQIFSLTKRASPNFVLHQTCLTKKFLPPNDLHQTTFTKLSPPNFSIFFSSLFSFFDFPTPSTGALCRQNVELIFFSFYTRRCSPIFPLRDIFILRWRHLVANSGTKFFFLLYPSILEKYLCSLTPVLLWRPLAMITFTTTVDIRTKEMLGHTAPDLRRDPHIYYHIFVTVITDNQRYASCSHLTPTYEPSLCLYLAPWHCSRLINLTA